jgi:hypothetical protein
MIDRVLIVPTSRLFAVVLRIDHFEALSRPQLFLIRKIKAFLRRDAYGLKVDVE